MNTVRLSRVEIAPPRADIEAASFTRFEPAGEAANGVDIHGTGLLDRPWRASTRRERLAGAAAAAGACAFTFAAILGLFAAAA